MAANSKETVLYRLNRELQALGIQYTGDDPQEAADGLKAIKLAREGMPPCFGRSFSHDDLTCRQCEAFRRCCREVVYPKFTTEIPKLGMESCDMCDGDFIVELFGSDGKVVDFACSTDGCRNTWRAQQRRTNV